MLILASASPIRRQILENVGLEFEVVPANIDENAEKDLGKSLEMIAKSLAEAKAVAVSLDRPGDWVIGSDSVVGVDGALFNKPASREEAAEHLRKFSGKKMLLTSGVALAHDGEVDWSHFGRAELEVRDLSEEFIQSYLDSEWPDVGNTVGVFRIEGRGIQLFETIAGGHFTILGMPLLPLLKRLRNKGLMQS
ncbi:Maf family protein [Sphingomonas daechungensis]|uniref:Maf family protein n=1 Tax=Sphingomonas daechungensis TaxID=1176646 RepID=UPI0037834F51